MNDKSLVPDSKYNANATALTLCVARRQTELWLLCYIDRTTAFDDYALFANRIKIVPAGTV